MNVLFHWIGGATFILTIGNLKIAVDPVLCEKGTVQDYFWFKSKRIEDPVYVESDFDSIDMWLITHNHEDHLDSIGLSKISNNSQIISNANSKKYLHDAGVKKVSVIDWGEKVEYNIKGYKIEITAIPAIHGVNPISAFFAGKVNGYYLSISKGKETIGIYITGDTVYKKRIIHSLENRKIDLMIPNMGAAKQGSWIMTLTLNSKMLKKMMSKLNPSNVIPVHFGTFEHYKESVSIIKELNDSRIQILEVGDKLNLNKK